MKRLVKRGLLVGIVLISLMFLAGCGTLETLINKDGTGSSFSNFIGGDKTALPASTSVSTGETAATSAGSMAISLYFADSTGKYLIKEERMLPKTVSLAKETVTQWLKGPAVVKGTSALAPVSTATVLLGIAIKDNVAIVDLSKEFLQPNSKVSHEVALYGLVNTLTQFSTIKQVQIRIEGKTLTKYGTIDATKLVNKASLIKGTASTDPIFPSSGTGSNTGSSSTGTGSSSSGTGSSSSGNSSTALPNSPSSINLFNYPPSST